MTDLSITTATPTKPLRQIACARGCTPYVVATSIEWRRARPVADVSLYGPWRNTGPKSVADVHPLVCCESVWKLDIVAAPMANPRDVILLIALIEHVGSNPSALKMLVEEAMIEALDASPSLPWGMHTSRMIEGLNRAIDFANGGPNLCSATQIDFTAEDVVHFNVLGFCRFVRSFSGYGGIYCLSVRLIKAPDVSSPNARPDRFARRPLNSLVKANWLEAGRCVP